MMKISLTTMAIQLMFMKNQMVLLMNIVAMCLLMSAAMMFMSVTHWFSAFIVLIYVSGIMVLFMFVTSLCPNEKNKLAMNPPIMMTLTVVLISLMGKNLTSTLNLKANSMLGWSIMSVVTIVLLILLMAYLPPKMIKSLYKGMKSSK